MHASDNEAFFKTTAFGYALLKEIKMYYRGLKFTSGFHKVILQMLGLKKDIMATLRDGTSVPFDARRRARALYWGIVNMKYLNGKLCIDDGKICITIPKYRLKLFLTSLNDLFIVGEVFANEVYRPLVNTTLKNKVVVDIGSFIGITPIYFALLGAKVLGYEVLPVHHHFSLLNLKANDLMNRAVINHAAVGGIKRKIAVPLRHTDFAYSIRESALKTNDFTYVDVITLEDIIEKNSIDKVHLLKLDCEGCEYELLRSIDVKNLRKIKELIMEFHGSPTPILEKLRKTGFCTIKLQATIRAYNKWFRE